MSKNYYTSGGFNVICDVCSKKIKASDAKQRWDGLVVCPDDFEHRHPQDYVKAKVDKITVPFTRPRPVDAFRLISTIQDTTRLSDDDRLDDYMEYSLENPYFGEDYLEILHTFVLSMLWNRTYSDTVNTTDLAKIVTKKTLSDTVPIIDSMLIGSVYRKAYTDTTTVSDAGSMFFADYVGPAYFESDYVGLTQTF